MNTLQQILSIKDPTIRSEFESKLSAIEAPLIDWLNQHCPYFSLLHGDLWSGNVLFDSKHAWLIDPAVYCGDAEADLAMTELFGGFNKQFYQGYQSIRKLSPEYPNKRTIYNLYHLFNHYNLFGQSYLYSCQNSMDALAELFFI